MNYRHFISPGPRFPLEAKFLAHIKIPSHLFLGENGFHYSLCFTIWKTKKKERGVKKKKARGMMQSEVAGVSSHTVCGTRCLPAVPACQGVSHTSCCTFPSPGSASWLRHFNLEHTSGIESEKKRSFYGGLFKLGLAVLSCPFCLASQRGCGSTWAEHSVIPWDAVEGIPVGIWDICSQPGSTILSSTRSLPCTGSSWCHRFLCSALHLYSSFT